MISTIICAHGDHRQCGGFIAPLVYSNMRPCACACHLDGMDGKPFAPRVPFLVGDTIESWNVRIGMRPGWFLRGGTSKAPRGWFALERGMDTTTAVRHLVAVIAPEDLANLPTLYPEAFFSEVAAMREP